MADEFTSQIDIDLHMYMCTTNTEYCIMHQWPQDLNKDTYKNDSQFDHALVNMLNVSLTPLYFKLAH